MPIFPRDEGGFTLAEMLLVLAITALAAGLVVGHGLPGQQRIERAALQSFVRSLRAEAMRTDRHLEFGVGAAGHSLEAGAFVLALVPEHQATVMGPNGVSTIVFNPDGSTEGGLLRVLGPGYSTQIVIATVTGNMQP